MIFGKLITLSSAGSLPTEFQIFVPGWNDTEHGRFLFDADAAKAVMAAYRKWGVDLCIDLEHQTLNVDDGAPTRRRVTRAGGASSSCAAAHYGQST